MIGAVGAQEPGRFFMGQVEPACEDQSPVFVFQTEVLRFFVPHHDIPAGISFFQRI